jgi:hypothetical protein
MIYAPECFNGTVKGESYGVRGKVQGDLGF